MSSDMKQQSYYQIPGLEHVYLEDSYVLNVYVLNVKERPSSLEFLLELVLTEKHPHYVPPGPDEQYCYSRARLIFPEVETVRWLSQTIRPYSDATGDVDYGNIDELVAENGHYRIAGDWGAVEVASSVPTLKLIKGIETGKGSA